MARTVHAHIDDVHEIPLPEEVRSTLGIVKGSTVTFVLDEHGVRILPVESSIAHIFGSVGSLSGSSEDFDDEIEEALQDHADQRVRSSE